MLWMYIAMLETAEQKEKITYIYENYADLMYCEALKVVGEHYLAEDGRARNLPASDTHSG